MENSIIGITLDLVVNDYFEDPIDIQLRGHFNKEDIAYSVLMNILSKPQYSSQTRLSIDMNLKNLINQKEVNVDKGTINFDYLIKLTAPFYDKTSFLKNLKEIHYSSNLHEIVNFRENL